MSTTEKVVPEKETPKEKLIDKVAEILVGNLNQTPQTPPPAKTEIIPPKDGRQKSTLNLNNIGKVVRTTEETPVTQVSERIPDKPIDETVLRRAWEELIVLRKNQIAEVTLLKRDYSLQGNTITVPLTNPIEEPVLHAMRASVITFLRDRLGNSSLMVVGKMQEITQSKNVPYTNKDKFEYLAERNPVLKEMKERFGLDPDL